MTDPAAGGHQVEAAGSHGGLVTGRIRVVDAAREQPGHGLQTGVRVRWHVRATGVGDIIGAVMVHKAPRTDHGAATRGKGSAHLHGTRSTQRNLPGVDDLEALGELVLTAQLFGGIRLHVAHWVPLPSSAGPRGQMW